MLRRIPVWIDPKSSRSVLSLAVCFFLNLQIYSVYTCEYTFTSQTSGSVGNFSSPGYPDSYSMNANCRYVFQGTLNERINISFLEFDLEPGTEAGCRFDYIDIFTIDIDRTKNLEDRLCGESVPKPIISIHQRIELVFKSDYAGTNKGFFGAYRFIEETWQPFPKSTEGCGETFVRGVGGEIRSPGYPNSFPPNSQCTWSIRGEDDTKIVLNFLSMNLGNSINCVDTFVAIYNGFASVDGRPDAIVCKVRNKEEFKSKSFRVVVRFQAGGGTEMLPDGGFRIVWTAVKISQEADVKSGSYIAEHNCRDFLCKGGEYCIDTSELLCNPLPRYCIAKSLRCNNVPNCGAYDESDEEGCFSTALLVGGVTGASLLFCLLLATSVAIYRKRSTHRTKKLESVRMESDNEMNRTKKQKKKKKTQKNKRTHQLNSLERSPSTKRRPSCPVASSLQPLTAAASGEAFRDARSSPSVSVNYGATTSCGCSESSSPRGRGTDQGTAPPPEGLCRQGSTRSSIRRIRSGMLEVAYQPLKQSLSSSSPVSVTRIPSYKGGGGAGGGGEEAAGAGEGEGGTPAALSLNGRRFSGAGLRPLAGKTTYLVRCTESSLSPGTSSTGGDTDSCSYVDLDPGSRIVSGDVALPVGLLGHSRRWNDAARCGGMETSRRSYTSSLV